MTKDDKLQRVIELKAIIKYCHYELGNVPDELKDELVALFDAGYYVPEKAKDLNIGMDHLFNRIIEDSKGFEKANKVQQAIDILLVIKEHYEKDIHIVGVKNDLVSVRNLIEEVMFE